MRAISLWAYYHKMATRFIIAFIHFSLILAAMMLAGYWQQTETVVSTLLLNVVACVAVLLSVAAHVLHKKRKWSGWHPIGYAVVRFKYFMVVIATFTAVLTWFYTNSHIRYDSSTTLQGSFVTQEAKKMQKPVWKDYGDEMKYYNDLQQYYKTLSRKELRAELKTMMKMHKQGRSDAGDTGLIILIILAALVATYFLLALACEVSCAGSDAGAIAISVVGLAGIIWGTIALIKLVKRKSKQKADLEQQGAGTNPPPGTMEPALQRP